MNKPTFPLEHSYEILYHCNEVLMREISWYDVAQIERLKNSTIEYHRLLGHTLAYELAEKRQLVANNLLTIEQLKKH